MLKPKNAVKVLEDISPRLAEMVRQLIEAKQTPEQIRQHVLRQAGRVSVLPEICYKAAQYYRGQTAARRQKGKQNGGSNPK